MATVLFVKPDEKQKRLQIGVSDDEGTVSILKIKEKTYISLGSPKRDDSVSDEALDTMRREDEIYRAFKKAMSLLADVDRSRYELKMKLLHAGYSAEAVEVALSACERYDYLNEERQLHRLVEKEANRKLRGKYYIKRKLMAKGYSSSAIDRVTAELTESGEIDFDANLEILKEKKGIADEEEALALKYKYGYRI